LRLLRATVLIALFALLWPTASPATVTCLSNVVNSILRVTSDGSDNITISRSPTDTILVNGETCDVLPLSGVATVDNTATIQVNGAGSGLFQNLLIDLSGGTFGPGLGAEPGIAEIEFDVTLGAGQDRLEVRGGDANDTLAWGSRGVALNGDGDRDVTFRGVEQIGGTGGAGNDLLTAAGGFGAGTAFTRAFGASGFDGDDRVIGGRGNDFLEGDAGSDRLVGGAGLDRLLGGDGRDRLLGRSGGDHLEGGPGRDEMLAGLGRDLLDARDGIGELVHGGPGRDRAKVDRGLDRVRAVEVLVARLSRP
jgi:Ca2+-binding RTX toxin-like protein